MGHAILNILGFIMIMMGLYAFFNPTYPINFISHEYRTIAILDSASNNSTYQFNFTPQLISKYYENLDNNLELINSVDIFIDEYKNGSSNNFTYALLNEDLYNITAKNYRSSLRLQENTLKENNVLILTKSSNLNISRISLTYYGSDYRYYNQYKEWFGLMYFIIILLGIILVLV